LVDTSVWIDHLRRGNPQLRDLLEEGVVYAHPAVIGELACGNITRRREVLELLQRLPQFPVASDDEVMTFIDNHSLYGKGLGWVDAHLLASTALSGDGVLFTLDKTLQKVSKLITGQ